MSPPSKARVSGAGMKVDETVLLESVAETDCAEVRREESEGDTEGWDEVMNEACWLDSEEESVRMSVGDVGM